VTNTALIKIESESMTYILSYKFIS